MFGQDQIVTLIEDLVRHLRNEKESLYTLNRQITNDTDHWIQHDHEFVLEYLGSFLKHHKTIIRQNRKPRGSVLIVLSYNEPFVLSVIPVFNALIAGNDVYVRPSSLGREFFDRVWFQSGIVQQHTLSLHVAPSEIKEVYKGLCQYESVYFFGGQQYAAQMSAECGKSYIPFYPEVEGSDTKVILPAMLKDWDLDMDARLTFYESFNHAGQSCQRIHGVFVPNTYKDAYIAALQAILSDPHAVERHIRPEYVPPKTQQEILERAIAEAKPAAIYRHNDSFPIVVADPIASSEFVFSAYFLPTLWVIGYDEFSEVLQQLRSRRFKLGLNIWGADSSEVDACVEKTRFSRYTLNSSHSNIRPGEGWGGLSPTGFSGYQSWIEHFSYPFRIIK